MGLIAGNTKHANWYELQNVRNGILEVPENSKLSLEKRVLRIVRIKCVALGYPHMAEDLSQEILLWLIQKDKYRGQASLDTYLSKVIPHALFHMLRTGRFNLQEEVLDTMPDRNYEKVIERINESIDSDRLLSALINSRPDLERRILRLIIESECDEISQREIVRRIQAEDPDITRYKINIAIEHLREAFRNLRGL